MTFLLIFVLAVIDFAGAYSLNGRGLRCLHKKSYTLTKMATASEPVLADDLQTATDLTNHKLWCTVDGFNAVGVNCALVLEEGFKVKFTKGISAYSDGFWRVIKMTDGSEVIEATHPIIPEYMLLFDIWEPNILWRGQLNKETMTVSEGQVITNKKRLGIFPYTEVIATFTAQVYLPDTPLPEVTLPSLEDQQFYPPEGFETPFDMKRYPEIFDPEYVDWWFAVEEALGKGETPPPRPKDVFLPVAKGSKNAGDAVEEDANFRSRRGSPLGGGSSGGGAAFGKKK